MSKAKTNRQKNRRAAFVLGDDHEDVKRYRALWAARNEDRLMQRLRDAKQAQMDELSRRSMA